MAQQTNGERPTGLIRGLLSSNLIRGLIVLLGIQILALVILACGFYANAQACERPEVYAQELVEHARKHEQIPFQDSFEAYLEIEPEVRCDVLWQIRNAIYVGHNYAFRTRRAQVWVQQYTKEYAGPNGWYLRDPSVTDKTVKLNEQDVATRNYIQALEKRHGCAK
ncbi:YARHG domain-containing protein [Candidatus Uhrbacteria bacterium]|jgi:hypothetical protein|nr:YARHG domain-containing protein [Candidatus Uhrbacteria bacterium]